MCDFCETIIDEMLWRKCIWSERSKYSAEELKEAEKEYDKRKELINRTEDKFYGNYIYKCGDTFHILAETGDGYCEGTVDEISYCPYCGRKLDV